LSLCEGEVYSISDVKINENPASNYDDVTTTTRMGTNSQSAIDNFEDAHNIYSVNVDLPKDNPYVYTTVDNDVEALEIHLSCPGGLFSISGEGGM
jgi:predicted phage tail protein